MFNFRNNKLGMTLVEMVVSLVVLSILTTSTMGIIISSNNVFVSTTAAALDRQIGGHVFETISSVLRYTTHLTILDADEADESNKSQCIYIDETDSETHSGKLYFKHKNQETATSLYADSYYGTRSVAYSVHQYNENDKNHLLLTVDVYRDGKVRYHLSRVIKCVNLGLISAGEDANAIDDQSSPNATNQYLAFSVDEQLIAGGADAFSLEYKISQYIAKYNAIQNAYVSDLNKAYQLYYNAYDAESVPGISGTSDGDAGRTTVATYITRVNKALNIIYGPGDSSYDKSDITKCVNLRKYYQDKINELLKFTPTAAGFTEGSFGTGSISGYTVPSGGTALKTFSGDPFYGVVATKEELYAGFLLTYYDANGDENITKDEYPKFTDSDNFFSNTTIADALEETGTDNEMVILSYFKDNVTRDRYTALYSTTNKSVYLADGEEKTVLDKNYVSPIPDDFPDLDLDCDNYTVFTNPKYEAFNSWRSSSSSVGYAIHYTYNNDGKARDISKNQIGKIGTYEEEEKSKWTMSSVTYESDYNEALARLDGVTLSASESFGSYRVGGDTCDRYVITASTDLAEGWYGFKHNGGVARLKGAHIFYLEADNLNGRNPNNIAVAQGQKIYLYVDHNILGHYYYEQAYYRLSADGNHYTANTAFPSVTAHQFTDYTIYGVDWNTWYTKEQTGILNTIISNVSNFLNRIFNGITKNNIEGIGKDYGKNYQNVLGYDTQATIENVGEVHSYNVAWVVYSPKHGTWFYLPDTSDRLSTLVSGLSFTSDKDHPVPLDVDLDTGAWGSSTAMSRDISNNKLSSSGIFKLDTTSDVVWSALPVSARS